MTYQLDPSVSGHLFGSLNYWSPEFPVLFDGKCFGAIAPKKACSDREVAARLSVDGDGL